MNAEMIVSGREALVRQKNMVMNPAGLQTKIDCAGETSSNLTDRQSYCE
jgi:hypothetical protein